jgi:hypothetical protein
MDGDFGSFKESGPPSSCQRACVVTVTADRKRAGITAIIPINARYRIELDTCSWAVSEPRTRKGETVWEQRHWFRSLKQAGEWLVQRLIAEHELAGVDEIIAALHASSRLIANAIVESGIPDSWRDAHSLETESITGFADGS